jgi:hypothetical protein
MAFHVGARTFWFTTIIGTLAMAVGPCLVGGHRPSHGSEDLLRFVLLLWPMLVCGAVSVEAGDRVPFQTRAYSGLLQGTALFLVLWSWYADESGRHSTGTVGADRSVAAAFVFVALVYRTAFAGITAYLADEFACRRMERQLQDPLWPRCVRCGYSLRGLTEPRCPECGTPFGVRQEPGVEHRAPGEDSGNG